MTLGHQNTLFSNDNLNPDWTNLTWLAFDTETTGVSPTHDRIVTAAIVTRHNGLKGEESQDQVVSWLANPGVDIPIKATQIHGVTTEHARQHGSSPADVADQLNTVLANHMLQGAPVIVFNASFDLPLLEAESKRHGVKTLKDRLGTNSMLVLDPLVLDRAVNKYRRGKRTLGALVDTFGLNLVDAHDAVGDSRMTLNVLTALLSQNPKLLQMEITELMDFQREEHTVWAENFEQYLANRGRETRISRHWV